MNFGFCNALYGELSVAQNLEKSRALGFGTYETGAWSLLKRDKFDSGRAVQQSHLDDWSLIDDIGQAAADTGVSICCIHAPPPGIKLGDPDFDDNFFIYEALLARMQKLGISLLLHHAGNGKLGEFQEGANQPMWNAIVGSLKKLRDVAANYGVQLTIETGSGLQDLTRPEALKRLLDEVEGLSWAIDVQHAFRPGQWTYPEYFEAVGDKLAHMHVPDGDGFISHGGIPGQCTIDWDEVMGLVRQTGYDGNAIIETDLRALDNILGYYLNMMKEEGISAAQIGSIPYSPPNQYRYGTAAEGNTKLTPVFDRMPGAVITLNENAEEITDIRDHVILTAKKQLERFWNQSGDTT